MIKIENPTGRNTKAHIVTINENEFFFSYETCIAFRGYIGGKYMTIRRPNEWGPTTGRHFRELGCKDFDMIDGDKFELKIENADD